MIIKTHHATINVILVKTGCQVNLKVKIKNFFKICTIKLIVKTREFIQVTTFNSFFLFSLWLKQFFFIYCLDLKLFIKTCIKFPLLSNLKILFFSFMIVNCTFVFIFIFWIRIEQNETRIYTQTIWNVVHNCGSVVDISLVIIPHKLQIPRA